MLDLVSHPYAVLVARFLLGGVFLAAASGKLLSRGAFAEEVREYEILPGFLVHPFALTLPWVELTVGTLLLIGLFLNAASILAAGLLGVFSAAIALNLLRGKEMDCHCFGQLGSAKISWQTIARNLALVTGAMAIVAFNRGYAAVEASLFGWVLEPRTLPATSDAIPVLFVTAGVLAVTTTTRQALRIQEGVHQLLAQYKESGEAADG